MNLPNEIKATFTRNIILGVGTLRVYKEGILFLTFTQNDITITGNYFTIDISNLFPDNGDYYILFDEGLITSIFGEHYSVSNPDIWKFTILDGEFDSNDFNNEFLIN